MAPLELARAGHAPSCRARRRWKAKMTRSTWVRAAAASCGSAVAHARGEGHDPLAYGHARDDAVHELRGRVVHPAGGARGTDRPVLAGEGDQVLGVAAPTDHAGETSLEPPAVQEGAEPLDRVAGQAAAVRARGREVVLQAVELLGHEAIDERGLGVAAAVGARGEHGGTGARWGEARAGIRMRRGREHGRAVLRAPCQRQGGVVSGSWSGARGARPAGIRTHPDSGHAVAPAGGSCRRDGVRGRWHAACLVQARRDGAQLRAAGGVGYHAPRGELRSTAGRRAPDLGVGDR